MATDSLAGMAERLRASGLEPRQIGPQLWESRCPGRCPVDHVLHFGRDNDRKLSMRCQSPANCSFSANLEILLQSLRDRMAQPDESEAPTITYTQATDDQPPADLLDGAPPVASGVTEKTRMMEKLLRIADDARPFRRPDGRYSVSIAVDGHQECHDLESPEVVRWLTRLSYESAGQLPSPSSLSATVRALTAQADIAGTFEADFVRVGCNVSGTSIFLDLGDSTWRAVEIQASGWQVVDRPNVHFRRSPGQRALPIPAREGSFALLSKYVNVAGADIPLLIVRSS